MFITIQHHIVQAAAIHHLELNSPLMRIHLAGGRELEIIYATKADAESAFRRVAGALEAVNTELDAAR